MTNLLLASLCSVSVFACATSDVDVASPDPAPRGPAIGVACAPGADILLHIDRRADRPEFGTASFVLYTTGAWTHRASGKAPRSGCLAADQLKAVDTAFATASWKYTDDGPRCEVYAPNFTDYHYRGTKVISLRRCDGKILPASGSAAIDLATKTSTTALAADVVIEIALDTSEPKTSAESSFVVLANGAWTYVEYLDGKLVRQGSGSIPAQELAELKRRLATATWKTKPADVACAVWSPTSTHYIVGGMIVATRGMCDGQMFDKATDDAFAHLDALGTKLIARL